MALEQITFNIGAFNDSDAGGNNYFTDTVFEVKNQSDNTFATIYADSSGTTQIPQNGIDNVSNSRGECNFYIDDGDFYLEVNSQQKNFSIGNFKAGFANIDEVKAYPKLSKLIGQRITIGEYHAGTGYGGGQWLVVSGEIANNIDVIDSSVESGIQFRYVSSKSSLTGIGARKNGNSAIYINRALDIGGEWWAEDGAYIIDAQLNAATNNTVINCESRNAKFLNSASNSGNLLAIKSTGFRFVGGTIDGGNLVALVGDAVEDGSLVCAVADTEFKFKDTLFSNVLGDNSILGKQALLNVNNQGVVFDIGDCDFLNCRIKKNIEAAKDSQFISFKGNAVTNPTRGRVHGGSMIGVGVVLDSGVSTDKDGKCIRGYFNESSSVEFDIEVTGVYSAEFDEAFSKTTGMKGINIHDNHVIGAYTQPWDGVLTKSEYFVRNTMITKSSGVSRIHDNTVRGVFNKLVEAKHSTSIQGNSFSIRDDATAGNLNVLYEIGEDGINISGNTYELETVDKIFNFLTTPTDCSWIGEELSFTMSGDEGAGLGRRLIFGVSDISGFSATDISLNINTVGASSPTDIIFLNSQLTNGNISGLEFNNFNINTNNFFNYIPRVSGNNAIIDGVEYSNFSIKYTDEITHGTTYSLAAQNTIPQNISFDGFEIKYRGIAANTTNAPLNLDEVGISKFNRVYIHDVSPTGSAVGFLARFRGDATLRSNGLDVDGLTFKNMKGSQSRLVDVSNQDDANFSNIRFINTITTASKNGVQFSGCNNITVDNISANDDALTSWVSMVDINSGDNYVVGKVNCRGVKVTFGSATNTVDNTI